MGTYGILAAVLVALGLAVWVAMSVTDEGGTVPVAAQSDQPASTPDGGDTPAPAAAEGADGGATFVDSEVEAPAGGRVPLFYETEAAAAAGD